MPLPGRNLQIPDDPLLPGGDVSSPDYQERWLAFRAGQVLQNHHDDIGGAFGYLNEFAEVQITAADGRAYTVMAKPLGEDGYIAPFTVTVAGNRVYVRPGTIANDWEGVTPAVTLGGGPNTTDSPGSLPLPGSTDVLYARLEVEPVATEVETDVWELSGVTVTESWDIDFFNTSDAQVAQINPATGAVIQNGIYYRPLAEVTSEGTVGQFAFGPWEASFCEGRLKVLPGPVATIAA